LEKVKHDELVYKLTLKYLRRDGFDIGNNKMPEIKNILSLFSANFCIYNYLGKPQHFD